MNCTIDEFARRQGGAEQLPVTLTSMGGQIWAAQGAVVWQIFPDGTAVRMSRAVRRFPLARAAGRIRA